jgi:sarcosine oxidase subunit beta
VPRHIGTPDAADVPATADLVVVGGGVVGAATTFFAERAGLQVVTLERRAGLATLNTARSLEAFRCQFEDEADIAMMRESVGMFERFADLIGVPGYQIDLHRPGYLFVTRRADGPGLVGARVARQHAAGLVDVEALSGDEARRRFSYLSGDVTAAAFRAGDGWLASHELTYGFAAGAPRARFLLETAALGFDVRHGRVVGVHTTRGSISTPRVVVAGGPYSGRLVAGAGLVLPMAPVRRHRAGIKAHPLIPHHAPMTLSLDTGAHWRPEGPGAWLGWSGAFDERPDEPRDEVPADWTFPALAIDAASDFCPFWQEVARTLTHENVTVEAGQYDLTPDAKPLIGHAGGPEGLFVHTGYSGHGVMGSAAGARLLVDLVTGRLTEEANPFRVGRFAAGPVAVHAPL